MYRLSLGRLPGFIGNVLAHRATIPWPIDNTFRMFAPKCHCDMAAPANGQMRFKYLCFAIKTPMTVISILSPPDALPIGLHGVRLTHLTLRRWRGAFPPL